MLLQLIRTLLVGGVLSVLAEENSFYFSFPLIHGSFPTVHVNDKVNVTWFSDLDQAVLQLFCGGPTGVMIDEIYGLGGNGHMLTVVNASWTSPCHWRLKPQNRESNSFNSGGINVSNVNATPAKTWQPSDAVETICSASTATTVPTAALGDSSNKQALSTGASIGVGIVIGTALSGLAAAAWFALCIRRRRRGAERETKAAQGSVGPLHDDNLPEYYGGGGGQHGRQELHPIAIAEVDGDSNTPPVRQRDDSYFAEMSSDPAQQPDLPSGR
ncbi:hypothetical protein SLS58_004639 [Diplodia intermedia]|uniref:Uncharacterized protein n=1 Tax=Diplodia intermedia TaxID=856260 RepID=A0ABR3TT92_9PEZI